eukprot:5667-Heterococcus_DN1.PRE.3
MTACELLYSSSNSILAEWEQMCSCSIDSAHHDMIQYCDGQQLKATSAATAHNAVASHTLLKQHNCMQCRAYGD